MARSGRFGDRYVDGQPVWRVELGCNRRSLRDLSLDGSEVLSMVGRPVSRRHKRPVDSSDSDRRPDAARWPLSGHWWAVQQPSVRREPMGPNRVPDRKTQVSLKTTAQAFRGCFISARERSGVDGITLVGPKEAERPMRSGAGFSRSPGWRGRQTQVVEPTESALASVGFPAGIHRPGCPIPHRTRDLGSELHPAQISGSNRLPEQVFGTSQILGRRHVG